MTTPALEVRRECVPRSAVESVLRLFHLDVMNRGLCADELGEWINKLHHFPHLNYHPLIMELVNYVPEEWRNGQLCDPQILLQWPQIGEPSPITFHLDKEPPWAGDRKYTSIVAVPLSRWDAHHGGLCIPRRFGHWTYNLNPGDLLMMKPHVQHSGGINMSGTIRCGIYFRWIDNG